MKKSIAIIGGGPAALALASHLDGTKYKVTIYEKQRSLGRKFLVAGKGGFNLTHGEYIDQMLERYTPNYFLTNSLRFFDNVAFASWLNQIGIPTFKGSSNRVYPVKGIKPVEVLNAILAQISFKDVKIQYNYKWSGWHDGTNLIFNGSEIVKADYVVFALGGGSWKITGSDGLWATLFERKGVEIVPFQPSNCAYQIKWTSAMIPEHEGSPLKNIAISCGGQTQKGEAVITNFGLEGNAIYGLSPQIRSQLARYNEAKIYIDLKPTLTSEQVLQKLVNAKSKTLSAVLKIDLKLSPVQISIIKSTLSKADYQELSKLAQGIKSLPLIVLGAGRIDEAISTVGGIAVKEVSSDFELKRLPGHYCIGEMLDWDTPTGGYLIQGCVSMGVYLANCLNCK